MALFPFFVFSVFIYSSEYSWKSLAKWLQSGLRTQLQMVNQSIIYDEWLIKGFLRAFMIHAESGVTMKRSDGDVTAQSSFTTWKVDRLKPITRQPVSLPPLICSPSLWFFFFFSFFFGGWYNSLKAWRVTRCLPSLPRPASSPTPWKLRKSGQRSSGGVKWNPAVWLAAGRRCEAAYRKR